MATTGLLVGFSTPWLLHMRLRQADRELHGFLLKTVVCQGPSCQGGWLLGPWTVQGVMKADVTNVG